MQSEIIRVRKNNGYYKYLLISVISTTLGAGLFGGISIYNIIRFGEMLAVSATEKLSEEEIGLMIKRKKRCRRLANISLLIAALNIFFIVMLIWGIILTVNDYTNATNEYLMAVAKLATK